MRVATDGKAAPAPSRAALIGWCSYDWANSAFAAVIVTFVFPTYFSQLVVGPGATGAQDWGLALGISGVAVALTAPIVGAVADRSGRLKLWLAALTLAAALFTGALWFVRPQDSDVLRALVLVALANISIELAIVFYNAMLPRLAPPHLIGRLSGWGWASGYAGGLAALALCLVFLIKADPPPAFLEVRTAEPVRATAVLTAAWLLVFSLPLFLFVREPRGLALPLGPAVSAGWSQLKSSLRSALGHGPLLRFLIARMLYTDGLAALFAFGGLFAASRFGFRLDEVLLLGILLNVTGAVGAAAFGWLDDRIGPKSTILIALAGLIALGAAALATGDKTSFWIIAGALGLFVGPAQSASRSLMAHLVPRGLEAEMFGLFALSGKATAFLAPFAFSAATSAAGDIRAGMATILAFLAAGFAVLLGLKAAAPADAMTPIETDRLILRGLTLEDAGFIRELVNDAAWLRYIGDRGVRTLADARAYIENGPLRMYKAHGFGLYAVLPRPEGAAMGLCGVIKRETLPDFDLGFAFLPPYRRQGLCARGGARGARRGARRVPPSRGCSRSPRSATRARSSCSKASASASRR